MQKLILREFDTVFSGQNLPVNDNLEHTNTLEHKFLYLSNLCLGVTKSALVGLNAFLVLPMLPNEGSNFIGTDANSLVFRGTDMTQLYIG